MRTLGISGQGTPQRLPMVLLIEKKDTNIRNPDVTDKKRTPWLGFLVLVIIRTPG